MSTTTKTVSVVVGTSSNLKSAQSKKCRLLAGVRNGTVPVAVAKVKLQHDPLLQTILKPSDIDDAKSGKTVTRSKSTNVMTVEVEIEVDDETETAE
jgi:hypothetical protein